MRKYGPRQFQPRPGTRRVAGEQVNLHHTLNCSVSASSHPEAYRCLLPTSGRIGVCCLLLTGCLANQNPLPPFPTTWPLDGAVVLDTADTAYGELGPPQAANGEPLLSAGATSNLGPVVLAPCEGPACLGPVTLVPPPGPLLPNPLFVPGPHHDATWESIVNIVDDYFRIAREDRVQVVGEVLTEGRIETYPQMGATLLEPHRHDSVGHLNRLLSTFQTIRRVALVRVVPSEGGYQMEVVVEAQLEDLPYPEHATAGTATRRSDTSLPLDDSTLPRQAVQGVWYPIGRDVALEQRLLAEIRACLDAAPPGVVY